MAVSQPCCSLSRGSETYAKRLPRSREATSERWAAVFVEAAVLLTALDLSRFTHLAQGLDYWIQEIPTLKLVAGSEYFIKCLQVDMVANVTEVNI